MPSVQSSKSGGTKSRSKGAAGGQSQTGERDENYNLISVLYHALQGAETISQYIQQSSGDDELKQFLQTTRESYKQVAIEARSLLAERLEGDGEGEDEDGEDDE